MSIIIRDFKVEGMSCAHCEKAVKTALYEIAGVEEVLVSLEDKNVNVKYDENKAQEVELKQAIEEAGYDVM